VHIPYCFVHGLCVYNFLDQNPSKASMRKFLVWLCASAILLLAFPTQGMSPQMRLLLLQEKKPQAISGSIVGSINLSPTTPVNLTSLATSGNSDWAHWGFGSSSGFDHKSGAGHISNVSLVGGATSSLQYTASAIGFTWTDGTPDSAETNTTTFIYCALGANGRGYSFTVPADTTTRTLLVWIAAYDDTMLFTATLSDSSAGPYSDSAVVSSTTSPVIGLYTVTYNAASSGQSLTISIVTSTNNNTAAILSAVLN
jgi:hypothetical protein